MGLSDIIEGEIKKANSNTCDWEPQGNSHYLTTCGELVYVPTFKNAGYTVCLFCGKFLDLK